MRKRKLKIFLTPTENSIVIAAAGENQDGLLHSARFDCGDRVNDIFTGQIKIEYQKLWVEFVDSGEQLRGASHFANHHKVGIGSDHST